jgi:hypothetical protein
VDEWNREGLWAGALSLAGIVMLLVGCGRSERDRDRSEAGSVLRALEIVRAAPNENKRRPAEELSHMPCSSPIVCGARDSCAEAYQHLARGTDAALRVKSELDRLDKHPEAAKEKMAELSSELDRADREISGARESLTRCEEAASLMRRTFGI